MTTTSDIFPNSATANYLGLLHAVAAKEQADLEIARGIEEVWAAIGYVEEMKTLQETGGLHKVLEPGARLNLTSAHKALVEAMGNLSGALHRLGVTPADKLEELAEQRAEEAAGRADS